MPHQAHFSPAGAGTELTAPDATVTIKVDAAHTDGAYEVLEICAPRIPPTPLHRTGWAKSYYLLQGQMTVQIESDTFALSPGASITIPPRALHTFTVLSPSATFLVVSLTAAMSHFIADLDATLPHGGPIEDAFPQLQEVLGRHDVTLGQLEPAR